MKILFALAALLFGATAPVAQSSPQAQPDRDGAWPDSILDAASALPIQDGGRIKPLSTYASFLLLRLSGKRSIKIEHEDRDDERLSSMEWFLDLLYFPQRSADQPMFLVEDSDAVQAIGLPIEGKKKRDRYSFRELAPGMEKLYELAQQYTKIEQKQRTSVQHHIVVLANNMFAYYELLERGPGHLTIVPPSDPSQEEWLSGNEIFAMAQGHGGLEGLDEEHRGILETLQRMEEARTNFTELEPEIVSLVGRVSTLAEARGEGKHVGLELSYYRADLIYNSLMIFLLGFLAAMISWLAPKSRWVYRSIVFFAVVATIGLAIAITMRCIIRGRPPVSTLYETVLFVTAVGSIVGIATEWITRQRMAIAATVFLGAVGLFIAQKFEQIDKQDTMPSLVAVLDTNFWLATHVTSITMGYSAGMFAALLGSIYILGKLVGWRRGDKKAYRSLARMCYGVLCFGLIFSVVGTILGGIWANDSWGRFWGWDPKENGALLICLSQIAILHGRLGGYLRDFGVCMASAFAGTIVAFSWWGVNLLGVGLHSYGFTSGISKALWIYYGLQWGVVALGGVVWLLERERRKAIESVKAADAEPADPQGKPIIDPAG